MDATIIAGVGNIYANEALFRAGIHPEKPCGKLRLQQWIKLMDAVHETLDLAIAAGGTTLNDFYDSNGEAGYFQQHLRVYGRDGEACQNCGRKIRRIVQAGRSSFFCSGCQK
jgi:formamidopyrimidine-DNA glycosylase